MKASNKLSLISFLPASLVYKKVWISAEVKIATRRGIEPKLWTRNSESKFYWLYCVTFEVSKTPWGHSCTGIYISPSFACNFWCIKICSWSYCKINFTKIQKLQKLPWMIFCNTKAWRWDPCHQMTRRYKRIEYSFCV